MKKMICNTKIQQFSIERIEHVNERTWDVFFECDQFGSLGNRENSVDRL